MTEDDKALVERLRDWGDTIDPGVVTCGRKTIETAADRIEALIAENERLREALERIEREPVPFSANPIAIIIAMKETARAALGETK